jgi:hypothetical protein
LSEAAAAMKNYGTNVREKFEENSKAKALTAACDLR